MNRFTITIAISLIVCLLVLAFVYRKREQVLTDAFRRQKLCYGWSIIIHSIVYCLPSVLMTCILIAWWKVDYLVFFIGIFLFWIFIPIILAWLYILFRSRKVLTFNHLFVIGINAFNLVFLLLYVTIERPHHICSPQIMETYYEAHKAELDSLSNYACSILDEGCNFHLEFEDGNVAIFHAWKNGEGSNNWDVVDSKAKELSDYVGIDRQEFRELRKRLSHLDCISVAASSSIDKPVEIGFRRVMMSAYYYVIYADTMGAENYKMYYDSEMYIPYNDRVVFEYGSPAFGSMSFPGKQEYINKKRYINSRLNHISKTISDR